VRIKPGQRAVDRPFEQLAVVRLLGVIAANTLEHIAEQVRVVLVAVVNRMRKALRIIFARRRKVPWIRPNVPGGTARTATP
jgi:hypothetical protein